MAERAARTERPQTGDRLGGAAIAAFALALLGLAASTYLTVEHYTASTTFACPETATINCAKVTTSRWSQVAGIPVAVLGLAYFLAVTAITTPPAMRARALDKPRVVAAAIGVLVVVYLIWIELFRVDAICLWCSAVHLCAIGLFAAVLWHTATRPSG